MKIVAPVTFGDVLADWGRHEGQGNALQHYRPEQIGSLDGPGGRERAIAFIRRFRAPLIAPLEAACIIGCYLVEMTPGDFGMLRGWGGQSLEQHAETALTAPGGQGPWVRYLADAPNEITGPLLVVGRGTSGPFVVLDGLHRAAAWVVHVQGGREYSMSANVVITARPLLKLGVEVPKGGTT